MARSFPRVCTVLTSGNLIDSNSSGITHHPFSNPRNNRIPHGLRGRRTRIGIWGIDAGFVAELTNHAGFPGARSVSGRAGGVSVSTEGWSAEILPRVLGYATFGRLSDLAGLVRFDASVDVTGAVPMPQPAPVNGCLQNGGEVSRLTSVWGDCLVDGSG